MTLGYIGTYTNGDSKGIYSFSLDKSEKKLDCATLAAHIENPTYLAINQEQTRLYSVIKEENQGGICAFSIQGGMLKRTDQILTDGAPPCYVTVNRSDTMVLAANYHKGSASAYQWKGNQLIDLATVVHLGHGRDPERQEKAHVHYADFTPDQRFIVTVDLGTDQLTTYQLLDGQFQQCHVCSFASGTGPRHLVFHPDKPFAYVLSEVSSEIFVFQLDPEEGRFSLIQTIRSLPDHYNGHNQGGAIKISADGHFIYVSNRGHNSIGIYRVDDGKGKLQAVDFCSSEGEWPRDFELDPSGEFLVVANQNSSNLVLFKRNGETGLLSEPQSSLSVPNPVCVKFLFQ
ncbi:lactonase family protein [Sporolactobacillus sp. Y61]|uniref:Lactonase family protein n=1 Tax=Sporolactobacillus sp. Y61 TaxID=3160863 RepID=A0AAU8III3_9BACL